MSRPEIVVIGGGVLGLSTACFLARNGARVSLLERAAIPCGAGHASAGLLVPSRCKPLPKPGLIREVLPDLLDSDGPLSIKRAWRLRTAGWLLRMLACCRKDRFRRSFELLHSLGRDSLDCWLALLRGSESRVGLRRGVVYPYSNRERLFQAWSSLAAPAEGASPPRLLTPEEIRAVEPCLEGSCAGGVLQENEAAVDPARLLESLADLAALAGARIRSRTEVFGFEQSNGRIEQVLTTRGRIRAEQVVLAAGAWLPELLKRLGLKLPLLGGKGYSLGLGQSRDDCPEYPFLVEESRLAVSPVADQLRITWGLELGACDLSLAWSRLETALGQAQAWLPQLKGRSEIQDVRCGLRPLTPDGLPLLGLMPDMANLWLAGGHGNLGLTLGAGSGRLLAELMAGRPVNRAFKALSPARFARRGP